MSEFALDSVVGISVANHFLCIQGKAVPLEGAVIFDGIFDFLVHNETEPFTPPYSFFPS
ncbi:hypothetical protein [Janthinobacterium lividum]|uniref:hypothetical protein n=1 Tax=Janthinobacterium lividum TaxID=29581 RepID=UPI001E4A6E00|nr:hypothetical protein [Janthinobacterium lividum]